MRARRAQLAKIGKILKYQVTLTVLNSIILSTTSNLKFYGTAVLAERDKSEVKQVESSNVIRKPSTESDRRRICEDLPF